jgi:preprotein translocase subunit SecA
MGAKGIDLIEQAQRVAEGVMLELHANTWRYNKLVNQQRDIVVARRMEILTTDTALDELSAREPDRYAQLTGAKTAEPSAQESSSEESSPRESSTQASSAEGSNPDRSATAEGTTAEAAPMPPVEPVDREVLVQAAREIMLYHLDRAWADHLAFVSDVRSSIHLRSLGKESPLDEFHKLILDEFAGLPTEAVDKACVTFTSATITNDGVDLGTADLHRSTTTWTYMVHDNLFASGGAKTLQGIIGIFR